MHAFGHHGKRHVQMSGHDPAPQIQVRCFTAFYFYSSLFFFTNETRRLFLASVVGVHYRKLPTHKPCRNRPVKVLGYVRSVDDRDDGVMKIL